MASTYCHGNDGGGVRGVERRRAEGSRREGDEWPFNDITGIMRAVSVRCRNGRRYGGNTSPRL